MELRVAGRAVATYVPEPELDPELSPRPYLHPVRTLGGVVVTELMPGDHVHHLGVSLAIADVNGQSFWGGRTYVRGRGPTRLDNHGAQRHLAFTRAGPDGFGEELAWIARDGAELLREDRAIGAREHPRGWLLDFAFTLRNATQEKIAIGSPATNGRPGAGYGGFFWRAPVLSGPERVVVATARGRGEGVAHGSRDPWVRMRGSGPAGEWSLTFASEDGDPWFVRAAEYPGVGTSLAWDRPLVIAPGEAIRRRVTVVVAEGGPP